MRLTFKRIPAEEGNNPNDRILAVCAETGDPIEGQRFCRVTSTYDNLSVMELEVLLPMVRKPE